KTPGKRARPVPDRGMAVGAGTHHPPGPEPGTAGNSRSDQGRCLMIAPLATTPVTVVNARNLRKVYKKGRPALDGASFQFPAGRTVGLIGPNGAGKTTALKAMLGLIPFEGEMTVLGRDPRSARDELMRDVCFIADVAVLPRWIRVQEAIEFVAGVH